MFSYSIQACTHLCMHMISFARAGAATKTRIPGGIQDQVAICKTTSFPKMCDSTRWIVTTRWLHRLIPLVPISSMISTCSYHMPSLPIPTVSGYERTVVLLQVDACPRLCLCLWRVRKDALLQLASALATCEESAEGSAGEREWWSASRLMRKCALRSCHPSLCVCLCNSAAVDSDAHPHLYHGVLQQVQDSFVSIGCHDASAWPAYGGSKCTLP